MSAGITYNPLLQVSGLERTAHRMGDMRDENITNLVQEETLVMWITGIVTLLFTLAFLFFFFTIYSRNRKNKREARAEELQKKYYNFLSELVSGESSGGMLSMLSGDGETTLTLSEADIKNEFNRAVLKTNLMDLHRLLAGPEKGKLREVYLMLGFAVSALKELGNKNPYKRRDAVDELAQMDIRDAYDSIFKLINDKSEIVRDAAIQARAELDANPLTMLKELEFSFSPWQQSKIFKQVTVHSQISHDSLQYWLSAEREDISSFLLKLISHFHWDDSIPELLQYVQSGKQGLRMKVIEVLGAFPSQRVKDCLLEALNKTEGEENIMVVLKALSTMLTSEDQNWLIDLMQTAEKRVTMLVAHMLQQSVDVRAIPVFDENRKQWIQHAINLKTTKL